jgi:hypothetical protein
MTNIMVALPFNLSFMVTKTLRNIRALISLLILPVVSLPYI